jgi:inosine-uridine nucleoside N-ribohydrolase
MKPKIRPFIMDHDGGCDDISALALAAAAMRQQLPSAGYTPDNTGTGRTPLQLVGVTTLFGNRPLTYVNHVTCQSMRILGLSHVPVYSGASCALMPGPTPVPW